MARNPATAAGPANVGTIGVGRSIAFTILTLLVLLALLEGAVRVRAWMRYGAAATGMVDALLVPDPSTGLRRPRAGYVQESERISIRINSLGFRGDEISVEKSPHTIRIAALGASTTFCGEVSNNRSTWPSRLQDALQRAHPGVKVEVINAGVPGYVASDALKNLQQHVLPLQPDLVIYYEANNDLALDTRTLAGQQGLLDQYESDAFKLMSRYSLLFDLVHKNTRIMLATHSDTARKLGSLPPDLPARYVGELANIGRELQAHHIPFVLSTFFVKYRRDQSRDLAVRNASVSFYYMPWMTIDRLLDGIDLYNDAIVRFARSHGVPVIDDRTSIPADDRHFADWAHFSDAGAAAMGERMFRFLEEQGLIQAAIDRLNGSERRAIDSFVRPSNPRLHEAPTQAAHSLPASAPDRMVGPAARRVMPRTANR